jgi:hypothetical protein
MSKPLHFVVVAATFCVLLIVGALIGYLIFGTKKKDLGPLGAIFMLVFALAGTATLGYYVLGGKEGRELKIQERKIEETYQPWVAIWLREANIRGPMLAPRPAGTRTLLETGPEAHARLQVPGFKGAGILFLTGENDATKVDGIRMRQLPPDLRASVELGPKVVVVHDMRSRRRTIEWGAGARDKYEYQYWFRVVDRSTHEQRTFEEAEWRYEDSSFPDELCKRAFDYATEHL